MCVCVHVCAWVEKVIFGERSPNLKKAYVKKFAANANTYLTNLWTPGIIGLIFRLYNDILTRQDLVFMSILQSSEAY